MGFQIRPVHRDDLEGIRTIYNWAVANSTATMDVEPRSEETQAAWIAAHDGNPYPGLVAINDETGQVRAYASLSPYNPKPGYARTAEVSVYVHPDWHGKGVGKAMVAALMDEANARNFVALIALITSDNEASLRLHRQFGFVEIGTLRKVGRKFDRWVDVTTLQWVREDA